ncbi:site-specific DNA-methyltransferase [Saccharomonospora sp. CUA-673]|uniref:DNA-methyltransferase n=1 Tax=Saccharomonospora sp. CUA-673 TaxID=1904969 RepID=UPI00096A6539|nr:site-specific DNA-methyltransferase [Saccharomonospora sp. CUA-673]
MTSLYYRDAAAELHLGDAVDVMATLPSGSVDCVVTSPPYWGLRDYGTATWTGGNPRCRHTLGTTPHQRRSPTARPTADAAEDREPRCRRCGALCHDRQYGHEPTPEKYVDQLRHTFTEVRRVLDPRGTLWLNLGDGYSSNSDGYVCTRRRNVRQPSYRPAAGITHKSLVGIPWRVAFALQYDGWVIRNAIVWHKPNAMPESVRDRLSCRYEIVFLLTKQQDYYFNLDAIREPYTTDRPLRRKRRYGGNKGNAIATPWTPKGKGKNPGDMWSISTRPLRQAHCAPFPIDLPLRCIAAGSPDGGRVLDPFSGAGTTGLAARHLGRFYQGIDLRPDYHDIALRRFNNQQPDELNEPGTAA